MQFSQQAQEIFVQVLGKIHTFFHYHVRPKQLAGVQRYEIDELIYTELIVKVHDEVGSCALGIDMTDVQGMVYYLAGNCHISWD